MMCILVYFSNFLSGLFKSCLIFMPWHISFYFQLPCSASPVERLGEVYFKSDISTFYILHCLAGCSSASVRPLKNGCRSEPTVLRISGNTLHLNADLFA